MTATEVAEALEIKIGAYSTYETGRSVPRLETTTKISKLFDITIDDLLFTDLENTPSKTAAAGGNPAEMVSLLSRLNSELTEAEKRVLTAMTEEGRVSLENYLSELIQRYPDHAKKLGLK